MKRAPNQTVKAYKHLNTLMKWALKRKWILSNPCDIDRATSYKSAEPPTPNSKQMEIMLDEAREPMKTFFAIAAWGGLRRGEILELRRKDVEKLDDAGETFIALNIRRAVIWHDSQAIVRPPKTSSGVRRVILSKSASALVLKHLAGASIDPEALLFTDSPESNTHWGYHRIRPEWNRISKLANFRGRFHSLRSFAMTQYATQGATLKDLMERAGHNNVATAMRYQRESGRELDLVRKLG
jgi:integrase